MAKRDKKRGSTLTSDKQLKNLRLLVRHKSTVTLIEICLTRYSVFLKTIFEQSKTNQYYERKEI